MSKAALIDLDGTLSDSGLAIIKSINYALENLGYEKLQGDPHGSSALHFGQLLLSLE